MSEPPPPPPPPPPEVPPPPPSGGSYGSGSGPTGGPPAGNPLVGYWKQVVLERYAKFDGRARRAEYWWFTLGNVIVAIVLSLLGGVSDIFTVIYFLYALAVLIPSIAVAIRRLHDTDKSGWWLLISLVP